MAARVFDSLPSDPLTGSLDSSVPPLFNSSSSAKIEAANSATYDPILGYCEEESRATHAHDSAQKTLTKSSSSKSVLQKKRSWFPLDCEPVVFAKLLEKLQVKGVEVEEIRDVDSFVARKQQSIYGIILSFKSDQGESGGLAFSQDVSSDVFFANQVMPGTAAILAILFILLNCPEIEIGPEISALKDFTREFPSQLKGLAISNSEFMRTANNNFARPQAVVGSEEGGGLNFVSFLCIEGEIFEMDGLREGPVSLGKAGVDWLARLQPVLRERLRKLSGTASNFSLLALKKQASELTFMGEAGGDQVFSIVHAIDALESSMEQAGLVKVEEELNNLAVPGNIRQSDAKHPQAQKVKELGVIKLLSDLRQKNPELQKAAAHELRMLSKTSDENRVLIAEAGAIPLLSHVIKKGSRESVDEAVTALLNLSLNPTNKRLMSSKNVIDPLVEAMISGSWETRENAAATLFSLSVVDDNRVVIGACGAIPPLIQILKHGSEQGKKDACKAVFNLSILNANKAKMVEEGIVGTLIEFLLEPASNMAERAVSVLSNLSTIEEGREAIAEDDDGIPGLVEVVEEGTSRGKENAAAALWQLAKSSPIYRKMILQEVVIPPLVALSQVGTPRAKDKATLLLKLFRDQ